MFRTRIWCLRKAVFSGCSQENCVMMSLSTICCVAVRRLFLAAGFSIETFSGHKDKSAPPPRATDSNSWESSAFKILEMGAFKHLLDLECQKLESMEIFWLFVLAIPCVLLKSCISRSALGCVGIKNCVKITHRQLVRLVSPHSWAGAHLAAEHGGDIGTSANSSK